MASLCTNECARTNMDKDDSTCRRFHPAIMFVVKRFYGWEKTLLTILISADWNGYESVERTHLGTHSALHSAENKSTYALLSRRFEYADRSFGVLHEFKSFKFRTRSILDLMPRATLSPYFANFFYEKSVKFPFFFCPALLMPSLHANLSLCTPLIYCAKRRDGVIMFSCYI